MFRSKTSRRCPSGFPMTSSSLRTKLKKSHHGVLRRPSLANSTKLQSSIQMLMPSNGQRIARKKYERGKPFLPNRDIQRLPLGMRRFHDWYLHVLPTSIDFIQACFPTGTFGSLAEKIVFDFNDMQICFHLGAMEMNLIRTWCL